MAWKVIACLVALLFVAGCSSESGQRVLVVERDGGDGAACDDCDRDGFTKARDCDDSNPDVYPEAPCQEEPTTLGGENWDYDCDGRSEPKYVDTGFTHMLGRSAVLPDVVQRLRFRVFRTSLRRGGHGVPGNLVQ